MVWLVIAGPALAVLAGSATMVIAYRSGDAGVVVAPIRTAPLAGATAPALQARNHAATPSREPAGP